MNYRPDIDGLRAVAVLAVVLCHVGLGFPGGYVGVDVFFVISGYLITRLMLKDLEAGSFSLVDFWQRRIRRILPALFVVVVGTAVAGWFLLVPPELAKLGHSIVSVSTMQANVHFSRDVGYFAAAADEKPLLHLWSLAVEEQFYLLMPLAVWGILRFGNRKFLAVCVAVLALLSLAAAVNGTAAANPKTYYQLKARAWELFVGVGAALMAGRTLIAWAWAREVAAAVGLGAIIAPAVLYGKSTLFPGWAALPPVLGTALLIHLGDSGLKPTLIHRLLGFRGFVAMGLISYSFYLWHWPLLVFFKRGLTLHRFDLEPTTVERIGLVVGAALLATISYLCVERPFRRREFLASRRIVFGFAATSFACFAIGGQLARSTQGFPGRLPHEVLNLAATARVEPRHMVDLTAADVPDRLIRLGAGDVEPRLFVWGDSHARCALPPIDRLCSEGGVGAVAAIHSGWPPVLNFKGTPKPHLGEFTEAVFKHLTGRTYEAVLIIGHWGMYFDDLDFAGTMLKTVERIQAAGLRVYFLKTVPTFNFNVPEVAMRRLWSKGDLSTLSVSPELYATQHATLYPQLLPGLKARGVVVLDAFPTLQEHFQGKNVLPFDDRGLLYTDTSHLSLLGADAISPTFAPMISELARQRDAAPATARAPASSGMVR